VSPDPRTNTAQVAPEGGRGEHVRDGGWCPCRPAVVEVLDAPRGTTVGFVVAHHADGRPPDPARAREDLIARLPDHVRAVVA
jgi:hypothetical protein